MSVISLLLFCFCCKRFIQSKMCDDGCLFFSFRFAIGIITVDHSTEKRRTMCISFKMIASKMHQRKMQTIKFKSWLAALEIRRKAIKASSSHIIWCRLWACVCVCILQEAKTVHFIVLAWVCDFSFGFVSSVLNIIYTLDWVNV